VEGGAENKNKMTEEVGTRIAKKFGQKVHFGTTKKIWQDDDDKSSETRATSRWHIEYDDGDEEDFDKNEVRIAIKLWNKHKKDDQKSKISKKRKIDGIVRDLDDDFVKQLSDDNDDGDDDDDDDDEDDDDDDYDDDHPMTSLAVSKTTKTSGDDNNNKLKRGKQEELQKKTTTNTNNKKDSIKLKSKAPPTKSSNKTGDSKNAVINVESGSDDEITTTTPATEKLNILDSFDVILPQSIVNGADNSNGGGGGDQCTLLVEVSDPNDAIALGEFGGSVGAIGRFESDPNGITLDLKGNQYRGCLLPGPTCLVVGFPSHKFGSSKKEQQEPIGKLRVEGIADEYTTLVQIDDHMKKLDAVVTGNNNNNEEVDSD
jgi:hypothetical protein